jgi:alpha-galactosidase
VSFTSPTSWTLFARGNDGLVWSRTSTGTWSSISGPDGKAIYGRPDVAIDSTGMSFVAVRAQDDSVWVRTQDATGAWSPWSGLGGVVSASPTLVTTLGRVYLFARGNDYTLWQINHADGAWGGWFKRNEFPSNSFTGPLGGTAGANGGAAVIMRGPDNNVYQANL